MSQAHRWCSISPWDICELLSNNARIILWCDPASGALFTWNRSKTFQCFVPSWDGKRWMEHDVHVVDVIPASLDEAAAIAKAWCEKMQPKDLLATLPTSLAGT
jgi:hypothetical protein